MSNFHGIWEGGSIEDIVYAFGISEQEQRDFVQGFEVLHAIYTDEDYSGQAFVVLRSRADGSLWEAHGSHCSCSGLEGMELESTCIEALRARHEAHPLMGLEKDGASWLASLMESRELEEEIAIPANCNSTRRAL